MRSFILAALAAIAFSQETAVAEEHTDNADGSCPFGGSVVDFAENDGAHMAEEAMQDAARDASREWENFMEDVECWWAERNNGDGQCAKRDRQAAMECCWAAEGMEWDWESRECLDRAEWCLREGPRCIAHGDLWNAEQCRCEWNPESRAALAMIKYKQLQTKQHKVMTAINIDVNLNDLEEMGQSAAADAQEGQALMESFGNDLAAAAEPFGPLFDDYARRMETADKERAEDLMDMIADGVKFDGRSIREIYGDPPTITMLKKANYNVQRMLQETLPAEEQRPENVHVSFEIPDDIEAKCDELRQTGEELSRAYDEFYREWEEKFEDLQRDMNRAYEADLGNQTATQVNAIFDQVKNVTETVNVTFSLASDYQEPVQHESNNSAYAGAAFGVIALIAGGAIVSNCTKKMRPNQEPLL